MIVLNISTVLVLAFGCLVAGYLTPVIWRTWRSGNQFIGTIATRFNLTELFKSDPHKWEHGTVKGARARRSKPTGTVQIFARQSGEFGGADTFWQTIDRADWKSFVPDGRVYSKVDEYRKFKEGGLCDE